jgi:hypothetical protein
MSKFQGKGARFGGAGALSSPARGFGGFSSQSTSSGLSYLVEPPDLSSISDANVVVSFKNLLKKDATTKTKALEELVAYVQAHPFEQEGGTEEAILEAWVRLSRAQAASFSIEQLVMIDLGSSVPSHLNRQCATRQRAVAHLAVRAGQIRS